MSNNTFDPSNEPLDEPAGEPLDTPQLDIAIGETEDVSSPAQDVGSPTEEESTPTVDLDEL